MNAIIIKGLSVDAFIGVLPEEKGKTQRLLIDTTIVPDVPFPELNDTLARTVDYAAVAEQIISCALARHRDLIETLATDIVTMILRDFRAREVTVEIRKFILPNAKYVAVRHSDRR